MILTQAELTKRLKSGDVAGAYLFCGEEAYLRRAFTVLLRQKLLGDPAFETFNHLLHEGAAPDYGTLLSDVQTPPFFEPNKLVEWHGADLSSLKESDYEALGEIVRATGAGSGVTLLISVTPEGLDAGTAKRPSAAFKRLSELFLAVNFEKSTDAQLAGWLTRHFTHEGVTTEPGVPRLLLERAGRSMDVLANEVDKLVAYARAHARDTVTEDDVRYVSVTTTEADAFGLTNALLDRDPAAAFRNLADMRARRVEPTLILGQISRLFADLTTIALLLAEGLNPAAIAGVLSMNAYRTELYARAAAKRKLPELRYALALCTETDRKAKTAFGVDVYGLLERLIAELATAGQS